MGRHVVSPGTLGAPFRYLQLVLLGVVLLLSVILAGAAAAGVLMSVMYGIRHSARVQQGRALLAIPIFVLPSFATSPPGGTIALTGRANYAFQPNGVDADGFSNVLVLPRRKERACT